MFLVIELVSTDTGLWIVAHWWRYIIIDNWLCITLWFIHHRKTLLLSWHHAILLLVVYHLVICVHNWWHLWDVRWIPLRDALIDMHRH